MPEKDPVNLAVSIVSYHSDLHILKQMLSTLLTAIDVLRHKGGYPGETQVVLVDNSEDSSLQYNYLEQLVTERDITGVTISLIKGHGNIGYGGGHNLVIKSATADYHLILNPDVELDPIALLQGVDYLEDHCGILAASPYVLSENGAKQYLCKRYPSVAVFLARGFFPNWLKQFMAKSLSSFEMHDLSEDTPSEGIPIVSGAFMLCRSKDLQNANGFDENYFMYFEDFDLSLRLGAMGKLAYLPQMKIRHRGGDSARKGFKHILMFVKSGIRFFNTWGWRFIQ